MAWTINSHSVNNGNLLFDDIDFVINSNWGEYNVYTVRFSSILTEVIFSIDWERITGYTGNPVAYICYSASDYENTEGTPRYYETQITIGSPVVVNISGQTTWYIVVRPYDSNSGGLARMHITVNGGGGGIEPTFLAEPVDNNTNIHIHVYDMDGISYDNFYYTAEVFGIPPFSEYSSSNDHTFTGLPEGTYTVKAYYVYSNVNYTLYTVEGSDSVTVTIGGGGSSDTWQLVDERIGTINSSFDLPYNNGLEGYHLYRFQFTPSSTTSITFSTTGGASVIGWLSRWYDQGSWDNTTGMPNNYIASDVSSGNLSITYNCSTDYSYYLWVRTESSSGYSGQITIHFGIGGGGGSWRYDQDDVQYEHTNVDTEFSEYVTLYQRVGSYFAVDFKYTNTATFAIVGSSNAYLYVTAGINGYNPTTGEPSDAIAGSGGTSLTTTVNAGTTYIVWVRGSTENVYGSVQIMVTPGSSQRWLVSTISTTEISTRTVPVSFYLSAGYMYCIPVRFTQPCNARFYSNGGYNRVAWLTSSNDDIDRNTGIPNGTILASDTSGDGDYDFSYSVAATTYYFWVRSTSFNDTTQLSAFFEPQISNSGKVWIYTSGGWKQATPWIYTANGWKQATPWIYTANGWKQTT